MKKNTHDDMDFEFLHAQAGDKRKKVNTNEPKGREDAAALIEGLLKKGTALFLERGTKTYRIKGYDAEKDHLIVETTKKGEPKKVGTRGRGAKVAAVPPIRGGSH